MRILALAGGEDLAIEIEDSDVKISIVKLSGLFCNFRVALFSPLLGNEDPGSLHHGNCVFLGGPLTCHDWWASERGNQ